MTEIAPQWTQADVEAATPQLVHQALAAGQLVEHLGTSPRRTGRRHDNDAPAASPLDQLAAQQSTRVAVVEKASTAPHTLTVEDIAALPEGTVADLVRHGRLTQFGMGHRRRGRR